MDLTPHVDRLRHELALLAEGGGAESSTAIDRIVASLESPVRLALLDALSTATDEITRDLAPGSVDVRLRAGEAEFVVTLPPTGQPGAPPAAAPTAPPPAPAPEEGEGTARINLRLPEHLKIGVEQAADAEHVSINAWLVRLVAAALSPDDQRDPGPRRRSGGFGQSWTGWVQ